MIRSGARSLVVAIRRQSLFSPLALGTLAPLLFIALAMIQLRSQGVYQDELHQAAGVFAWRGGPLLNYAALTFDGLPVLNMTYSAAIKTALYGAFLWISGAPFSVVTWRLFGILTGALSLALLFALAGKRIPPVAGGILAVLLLTDTTVLLLHRHDYGPVALAFLLRVLFVVAWLRAAMSPSEPLRVYFVMGVLVGLAAFEKASSAVLVLPLAVAVMAWPREGAARRLSSGALGLATGALPLIVVNVYSLVQAGSFISFSDAQVVDRSAGALAHYLGALLWLGSGARPREFVLGDSTGTVARALEACGLVVLLACALFVLTRYANSSRLARFGVLSVASYVLVGFGTWLLPGATDAHHWLLATPFQYIGIAIAFAVAQGRQELARWRVVMGFALLLFVGNRLTLVASTATALTRGDASHEFDPSLTRLGDFVAAAPPHDAFIAADWGVSTPMFCVANGPRDRVFEPYWFYSGPADLDPIVWRPEKSVFFVVTLRPVSGVRAAQTQHLLADIAARSDLVEIPLDPQLRGLPAVAVREFRKRASPEASRP